MGKRKKYNTDQYSLMFDIVADHIEELHKNITYKPINIYL